MANGKLDTSLVDKAIKFAVDAHSGTERRGKAFPYVVHVLEAMSITASISRDPELLAAAALHDTVEDTIISLNDIRREFGDRVAELVKAETDIKSSGKSWRERKQEAIDRLGSASRDAKTVAIGDKLSNMRAIAADYHRDGDKLWSLFHAPGGRTDHEWHYRGLATALSELEGTEAYSEFVRLIDDVFSRPEPETVDMNDYSESGDGFTATSYDHMDGLRMMKLYADFIPFGQTEREFVVSRALTEMGLETPRALRIVTDGKRFGVEFEKIKSKRSFARAISQEPDKLEEYSRQFARMCLRLHSTPCTSKVFQPAYCRFMKAVNESGHYSDAQKEKMTAFIRSIPNTGNCLHGDLHIGNALMAGGKEYWIDLSNFATGNPLFDLGMFYFVSHCTDDATCFRLFHISLENMMKVWNVFMEEYFPDSAARSDAERQLPSFAALYMVCFEDKGGLLPGMKEFIYKHLLSEDYISALGN